MSIPASRLAQYRSYNYYHVLAVCATSEAADSLVEVMEPDVWSHPPENPFGVKNIGQTEATQYCILIHGATDASFVINGARWVATTGGDATAQSNEAAVAIEGNLEIVEPKGIVFLDKYVECCNNMNTNSSSAVCVLKTFFVGFGFDEHTGEFVDTIADIPGIQFTITNTTGTFTEQGGVYNIEFVGMVGGGTRLPQYSRIPQSISFTASNTLGGTMRALQANIQSMYQPYYNCVRSQLQSAMQAANQDPTAALAALRAVSYVIDLDPRYENYTVTNQAQLVKEQTGCQSPANISISANSSIEDAIHTIMRSSLEVNEDMAVGDKTTKVKYEYKIHAELKQTSSGPVVTYYIRRFMQPREATKLNASKIFEAAGKASSDGSSGIKVSDILKDPEAAANIIHFDYIYTGKNIDILEFEIKMAQGLQYLQTATVANTFRDQTEGIPAVNAVVSTPGQSNLAPGSKMVPTPVFFGSQITAPTNRNTFNQQNSVQAAYSLAAHSSIEVAGEATIRIVGNTNLLTGIANYTSSKYMEAVRQQDKRRSSGGTGEEVPETERMLDYGTAPSFAHITIKMPRHNDDIALLTGDGDGDYAVDFWFNGLYYIVGVENQFEGGAFTQVLHMVGLPMSDLTSTEEADEHKPIDLTQRVADCMQGKAGCGQTPPATGGTSNTTVPSNTVEQGKDTGTAPVPQTAADAKSANKSAKKLSDVKGWDSAKPESKAAIQQAATATGANEVTLAQMAAIESGFGRATVNPKSKARGMFQIVPGTWSGVVNSGQVPGIPPGTSFEEAHNPTSNATVAATLMLQNQRALARVTGNANPADVSAGDTYLAHFLGVGGATAVIQADNQTSGSMTVKEAYIKKFGEVKGTSIFNSQKKANSSIISDSTTVGELRANAEASMATTVPLASVKASASDVQRQTNNTTPPPAVNRNTTRTGAESASANRDCRNEEAKTASTTDCNQSRPAPDSKK